MSDPAEWLWKTAPEPHPALLICVVVPVRNEAAGLAATLNSLARQETLGGESFCRSSYEVLLLANNCEDASACIARDFAIAHPDFALHIEEIELPPPDAHIGYVRKLLMDEACLRLGRAGAATGIVASTDGDTVVGAQWLAATLQEFVSGIDAVGGRILLDSKEPIDASTLRWQRCDTAYRLAQARLEDLIDPDSADPWPRHHQHFCASLAVSREAYLKVGGIPDVRFLEDEALVAALRRADLRVRHSPRVRVRTSARRDGRVEVGLSWQLRQWSAQHGGDVPMLVEDANALAAMFQARRALRDSWRLAHQSPPTGHSISDVTRGHGLLQTTGLNERGGSAPTFGALWAQVQALDRVMPQPLIPVRQAIDRLQALIGIHTGKSAARSKTSSR